MADRLLKEFYDENLALYLRAYHQQSGTVYHTVQQSVGGLKHAASMSRPIYAHICITDRCIDADDMNYKVLADRVRYFKESEGGIEAMCKAVEL